MRIQACLLLLLACESGVAAERRENVIYVDPPVRLLTQCDLQAATDLELTCTRGGVSRTVALSPGLTVWKGRDSQGVSALRPGDRLDIKLGLDSQSREVATFIWANLVQVEGLVGRRAGRNWIRVHRLIPASIGEVARQPVFAYLDERTTVLGGAKQRDLQQGRPVIVIGERLDATRLVATRIVLMRE